MDATWLLVDRQSRDIQVLCPAVDNLQMSTFVRLVQHCTTAPAGNDSMVHAVTGCWS